MEFGNMLKMENKLWKEGLTHIAGIDEAGRGPLAGPVVAAAVVFKSNQNYIRGIRDSKAMTRRNRQLLKRIIEENAVSWGVGVIHQMEIDRINILQATLRAMLLAVKNLSVQPDYLLVDGNRAPDSCIPHETVIRGDSLSMSIAAASIIAKVTRDNLMIKYHDQYPQYGFNRHMGYATRKHVQAIRKHGFCPLHRRSFKPKALELDYDQQEIAG
jgi:ribonuclease HII